MLKEGLGLEISTHEASEEVFGGSTVALGEDLLAEALADLGAENSGFFAFRRGFGIRDFRLFVGVVTGSEGGGVGEEAEALARPAEVLYELALLRLLR